MTSICITKYNAVCNLGSNIDDIFINAQKYGNKKLLPDDNFIPGERFFFGKISYSLPQIYEERFNIRANRLIKKCLQQIDLNDFLNKYRSDRIAIILATTNTGVEEFGETSKEIYSQIGNPALYLQNELGTDNYTACISTACSSGIKVFSTAKRLIQEGICDAAIAGGVDSLAHIAVYGFNSLELLSHKVSNPFSANRDGINIGEAAAIFTIEKADKGLKILSAGESSDAYHISTPDPQGTQAVNAIEKALAEAKISKSDIDYINLHGTGTIANDIMESAAISKIFSDKTICSSTKPLTGHCLGAAAALEVAICCHTIKYSTILKHVYDGIYDKKLPKINLADENINQPVKIAMCNAFGFGGTNSVILIGEK